MTTMHDVAREAGVSHASVSAVINGKTGEVSEETRLRILDAIAKTGYKQNQTARQLKTGKFDTIAITFEAPTLNSLESPEWARVLSGVMNAATRANLDVLFPTSMGAHNLVHMMGNLVSKGLDGVLVYGPISLKKAYLEAIDNCPLPVVCVDAYPGFKHTVTIDNDNIESMRQAVAKLISFGHKNIAYIGHPPVYQCFIDRMQAFCEIMQENGLVVDDKTMHIVAGSHVDSCINSMISGKNAPTAIVIGDETQGISAWDTLTAAGIKIPDDVTLVIYDKLPDNHPGCDSVIQVNTKPLYELGCAATELLIEVISGEKQPPLSVRLPFWFNQTS